jgi:hypothetical protein
LGEKAIKFIPPDKELQWLIARVWRQRERGARILLGKMLPRFEQLHFSRQPLYINVGLDRAPGAQEIKLAESFPLIDTSDSQFLAVRSKSALQTLKDISFANRGRRHGATFSLGVRNLQCQSSSRAVSGQATCLSFDQAIRSPIGMTTVNEKSTTGLQKSPAERARAKLRLRT